MMKTATPWYWLGRCSRTGSTRTIKQRRVMTKLICFADVLIDVDDISCALGVGATDIDTRIFHKSAGSNQVAEKTDLCRGGASKAAFDAWAITFRLEESDGKVS